MRFITIILLLLLSICLFSGCSPKYRMVTHDGVVDVTLEEALSMAKEPEELRVLLSEAYTQKDRKLIEDRICELSGNRIDYTPRSGIDREELIRQQETRRLKYIQSHGVDKEVRKAILDGQYIVGMSKQEFIASRGEPMSSKTLNSSEGVIEILAEGVFTTKNFYFRNGRLSYWD